MASGQAFSKFQSIITTVRQLKATVATLQQLQCQQCLFQSEPRLKQRIEAELVTSTQSINSAAEPSSFSTAPHSKYIASDDSVFFVCACM